MVKRKNTVGIECLKCGQYFKRIQTHYQNSPWCQESNNSSTNSSNKKYIKKSRSNQVVVDDSYVNNPLTNDISKACASVRSKIMVDNSDSNQNVINGIIHNTRKSSRHSNTIHNSSGTDNLNSTHIETKNQNRKKKNIIRHQNENQICLVPTEVDSIANELVESNNDILLDEDNSSMTSSCGDVARTSIEQFITPEDFIVHRSIKQNKEILSIKEQNELIVTSAMEKSMAVLYKFCDESGNSRRFCDQFMDIVCELQSNYGLQIDSHTRRRRQTFVERFKKLNKQISPPISIKVNLDVVGSVVAYKFNIYEILQQHLLSVVCSDLNNIIVDESDKWKFPQQRRNENPNGEMGLSAWSIQTYDMFVNRVSAQKQISINDFLFCPLVLYMDKTGVDKIEKNSLEPVVAIPAIIKNRQREVAENWMILGYIPNLHEKSAAQRRTTKGKKRHRSSSPRDHHECMRIILEELKIIQKEIPIFKIRRGDEIMEKRVYMPVILMEGDNLSQDLQEGRVSNKTKSSVRMTRRCLTTYEDSIKSPHSCRIISKTILRKLCLGALGCDHHNPRNTNWLEFLNIQKTINEKNMYEKALSLRKRICDDVLHKVYGSHSIDNAYHDIDFGITINGIHTATATDILHTMDSGITPAYTKILIGMLTDSQKTLIDSYVQELFCEGKNRSSQRQEFPRVTFTRGFCSLTLLNAEAKRGRLFVLAILFQLREGRKLLSPRYDNNFDQNKKWPKRNEEVSIEPDSDEEFDENALDCEESLGSNNNPSDEDEFIEEDTSELLFSSEYINEKLNKLDLQDLFHEIEESLDSHHQFLLSNVLQNIFKIKSHNFLDRIHLPEKICDYAKLPLPQSITRGEVGYPSLPTITPQVIFEPMLKSRQELSMKLTMNENMFLNELLLTFGAFLRYGSHLLNSDQEEINLKKTLRSFHLLQQMITKGMSRDQKSNQWYLQKFLEMSHFIPDMLMYGNASGFSTQTGERGLKYWAKHFSKTAQKRSDSVFTGQVASRVHEAMVIDSIASSINMDFGKRKSEGVNIKKELFGQNYRIIITKEEAWTIRYSGSSNTLHGNQQQFEPPITNWFLRHYKRDLKDNDRLEIKLYTEYRVSWNDMEKSLFRACPDYFQQGDWFDYCWLKYMIDEEEKNYPCKIACFFHCPIKKMDLVLVQEVCDVTSVQDKMATLITKHYQLQAKKDYISKCFYATLVPRELDMISGSVYAVENAKSNFHFTKNTLNDYDFVVISDPVEAWPEAFVTAHEQLDRILTQRPKD